MSWAIKKGVSRPTPAFQIELTLATLTLPLKPQLIPTCCVLLALSGCAHPPFVPTTDVSSAVVEFSNGPLGYTQQYFFDDPVSCGKPSVISALDPNESKFVRMPAGHPITIWTSAWGLPTSPDKVAWCRPSAFSTQLLARRSYKVQFAVNVAQKKCGVILTSLDDASLKYVRRQVDGPEIAGGPLTKAFQCNRADDLSSLSQ